MKSFQVARQEIALSFTNEPFTKLVQVTCLWAWLIHQSSNFYTNRDSIHSVLIFHVFFFAYVCVFVSCFVVYLIILLSSFCLLFVLFVFVFTPDDTTCRSQWRRSGFPVSMRL